MVRISYVSSAISVHLQNDFSILSSEGKKAQQQWRPIKRKVLPSDKEDNISDLGGDLIFHLGKVNNFTGRQDYP